MVELERYQFRFFSDYGLMIFHELHQIIAENEEKSIKDTLARQKNIYIAKHRSGNRCGVFFSSPYFNRGSTRLD